MFNSGDVQLIRSTYGDTLTPDRPVLTGLTPEAAALDPEPIWARIEQFTRYWFGQRSAVLVLDGVGWFRPSVGPFALTNADQAITGVGAVVWQPVELRQAPESYWIPGGTYRLTGTVGDDSPVPGTMLEAFRRLAEYYAELEAEGMRGASSYRLDLPDFSESWRRPATAVAKALELSGAADLLKRWRYV